MTFIASGSEPLSEDDVRRLADLLQAVAGDNGLTVIETHGLLTAVACSPEAIMPSEWLPLIYGSAPVGKEAAETNETLDLLMRMNNEIVGILRNDESFYPLFFRVRDPEQTIVNLARQWCDGFMKGVDLRLDIWRDQGGDALTDRLLPIVGLSGAFDEREGKEELCDSRTVQKLCDQIPESVKSIYSYWINYRHTATATNGSKGTSGQAETQRREELCPCGSGKVFKQCCGNPSRLH